MRLFLIVLLLLIQATVFCRAQDKRCDPEPNQTVAEIVELCRDNQRFMGWFHDHIKLENMSQEDFDTIFERTTYLMGNLEIVASTAKRMVFPELQKYSFFENSSFHHNPELEVIGFPKLTDIYTSDDHMEFSHNPKLKELQFPVLAFLTLFDGNLTIANNSALKAIRLSVIKRAEMKDLTIVQNPSLELIEIDGSGVSEPKDVPRFLNVQGTWRIEGNEWLRNVTVTHREPEKPVIVQRMEIRKNRRLESIPYTFTKSNMEMWIEGNPRLERGVLEGLRRAADASRGRIQDYGECILDGPVTELSLLDDCVYIYGDLRLGPGARGPVSVRLARVEGHVFSGDLEMERLEFLLDTEIGGRFESDLCDFDYSRFRAAKKGVRKSCTEEETAGTSRRTEETTRRTTVTVEETTGTTEEREETTITTEETETATTTGTTKETTGGASTGSSTQFVTISDSLVGISTSSEKERRKSDAVLTRIVIICVAVALLLSVGMGLFFCWRKLKKEEEKPKKTGEESPSGSSSSQNSSSSRPSPADARKTP